MGVLHKHTDTELLVCLRQGDGAAFDELYRRYAKKLMAFSRTFFFDQHLAEEAVQVVFVRIWERRHKLDASKSFKSYLFQAAKHYMYNHVRNRKKECCLDEAAGQVELAGQQRETELAYQELEDLAMELINNLPKVQQEVFKLNKLDGMNSEQIALQMNLSKRTIEHHIYLATKTLKKSLLQYPSFQVMFVLGINFGIIG
ncbi:RNA polymerase sigma-70 factor, ECF subfamily [Cyclobacterium xiamenense]|uniref:RNA polymerase sigma-70 factor, ECF subfamily n=1 Tax=Cyclobacterium xiamenense TaxID=1297121 RepID=A0A1H6T6Q0_9BACT|nr:RNA polymerase sigma-70 factor [Cyclobacterium xiamenense]SEI73824.1 RNA polymerase sigma-70 factor, ECF subfamily [Cyclobacterium xiamenense]